jgi:RalA-binding protein 1
MSVNVQGTHLSVPSTPAKDRDRLPFPPHLQPSPASSFRQISSSAAAGAFQSLPSSAASTSSSKIPPQTLTVESLLKNHSSAPDPITAALEQAVNDRNVLSAQNTQLWKLIEKQRSGYNQILKELERIRGERDGYKHKLIALGAIPNGSDRRQKTTSERGSRPSIDIPSDSSVSSLPSSSHNRSPLPRHSANDSGQLTICGN